MIVEEEQYAEPLSVNPSPPRTRRLLKRARDSHDSLFSNNTSEGDLDLVQNNLLVLDPRRQTAPQAIGTRVLDYWSTLFSSSLWRSMKSQKINILPF